MNRFALLAGLFALSQQLSAQAVRLNAYGGYTFADKFNFDGYYGYDQAIRPRSMRAPILAGAWRSRSGR
jgi:hypothetical protein